MLAEFEIHGTRSYANQYEKNSQAQYAYFKAGNSKVAYNHAKTSTAVVWSSRSPSYTDLDFCSTYTDGSANNHIADSSWAGFAA